MHLNRRKMFVPLALAFTAAVVVTSVAPSSPVQAALLPEAAWELQEVRRVHAHFDSVLSELHAGDVSGLTKRQLANRQVLTATLRGYDQRATFPHNYDFAAPTPSFVDRQTGTLCAVAFLLESTGRRDIVNRVARANNNVWAADLKDDVAFASWLHENGITLAEAARIQPTYGSGGLLSDRMLPLVAGATIATTATSVGMTAWNLFGNADGHGHKRAVLGLVAGTTTLIIGAAVASQAQNDKQQVRIGAVGIAIGAVGIAAATRSLMNRSEYLEARRDAERSTRRSIERNISPILPIGKNAGTGVAMSIRF